MQTLPISEERVMCALWNCGKAATRREIGAKLPAVCEWADSTLLNFLMRLEKKGFVRSERQGNKNVYTPLVRRETYCGAATAEHLEVLCGGDLRALVEALADTGRLSYAKMEALARWLDVRVAESPEYDYD